MQEQIPAPIHSMFPEVAAWLTQRGAEVLAPDLQYSAVFSEQSLEPGTQELAEFWETGAWISWLGGPAVVLAGVLVISLNLRAGLASYPAVLEQVEALEQLRVLESGHRIAVGLAPSPFPPGIDTPEDLARAEARLQEHRNA